jgi:hypothetical protein
MRLLTARLGTRPVTSLELSPIGLAQIQSPPMASGNLRLRILAEEPVRRIAERSSDYEGVENGLEAERLREALLHNRTVMLVRAQTL